MLWLQAVTPLCNTLQQDPSQSVQFGVGAVRALTEVVKNGNDKKLLSFCETTLIPSMVAGLCYAHPEVTLTLMIYATLIQRYGLRECVGELSEAKSRLVRAVLEVQTTTEAACVRAGELITEASCH